MPGGWRKSALWKRSFAGARRKGAQSMEAQVRRQAREALTELLQQAQLQPGALAVIGCSTSEVRGEHIGTAGSTAVAAALLEGLLAAAGEHGVELAIQCCEHLNRALVVERRAAAGLTEVAAYPVPGAGGALAARAMEAFAAPVLVEEVCADAGLDIGQTLIGMHLRRVAVPVRLRAHRIGAAAVTAARTRPKLIGGPRAVYERPEADKHEGGKNT